MNRLKDEMEAVARELQSNNNIIERYAVLLLYYVYYFKRMTSLLKILSQFNRLLCFEALE